MTMKVGELDTDLTTVFASYKKNIKNDELSHIGDISEIKVMRYLDGSYFIDFLVYDEKRVGFSSGKLAKDSIIELEVWYVTPELRRQDLGYKYLYFLKNVLKQKILMGSVHSTSTQEFLKKQHNLKRFNISWLNIKTGEKHPFEKIDDKYGLSKKTDWQVLIESDSNQTFYQFKIESKIFEFKNSYDWLFTDIEAL